jgi:predicted secreted protein
MAQPVTFNGSKLYIQIGDGATPTEVFTAPCGLTSRGITFTKDTNDTTVPDCDDPDLPAWTERSVSALSWEATGSGVLAAAALPTWWDAFNSTESVNVRIGIDAPPADNGGYWAGAAHLSSFNPSGELGDKVQVAVTFTSDGAVTWVDAV